MPEVIQNTLYLTTPATFVSRDHLTLLVEVPVYPEDLPAEDRARDKAVDWRKVSIPIHHLESVCTFGSVAISPPALDLCWKHGVAVNYHSEGGYQLARLAGVPDTSLTLRRAHFRAADDTAVSLRVAAGIVAGKIQNARNSLLRGAREAVETPDRERLDAAAGALANLLRKLPDQTSLDEVRGAEGAAAQAYFEAFGGLLKQQRQAFDFKTRTRRPPRDRINCLLSFLYALVRHDCTAALTAIGLDPFVGFLHAERANRPALALDLMEEFRPWLADRLAVTLVNRQQVGPDDFQLREGGAVEFTESGRKKVIKAYQERKQDKVSHPLLDQNLRIAQLPFVQARILARHLRGDIPDYVPFLPK
jgi:CRISP-associated protein Cas1